MSRQPGRQESNKQESPKQPYGYDHERYKRLLAEAVDETRRLELIEMLIREKARDRLEAERASDRAAMTAQTVATVLARPEAAQPMHARQLFAIPRHG